PGLWDMHVHFGGGDTLVSENKSLLPLYLANGVTTVRDCSVDLSPYVFDWKAKIAEGSLLGPKFFGLLDEYGSVELGKKADLVLVNSNPLLNIGATKDIYMVLKAGRTYTKADLKELLSELEEINHPQHN
ncbi:amidohydrolase family protein, partial [Pricia sp.]|uniref:amidohydrolase family protein n=1 Tax=Pricia sp. TaxID=2268138 RepID=UPI003593314C